MLRSAGCCGKSCWTATDDDYIVFTVNWQVASWFKKSVLRGGHRSSHQSKVILFFSTTGFHRSTSAANNWRNSSGEFPTGSMYCIRSLSFTAGSARTCATWARNALTTEAGVFAGTMTPIQASPLMSGRPLSAKVAPASVVCTWRAQRSIWLMAVTKKGREPLPALWAHEASVMRRQPWSPRLGAPVHRLLQWSRGPCARGRAEWVSSR